MQEDTQMSPTSSSAEYYTVWNAIMDIVAAPSKALDAAREHPKWFWLPMLLNIALTVAVAVFYRFWVDSEWLIEETIRSLPPESAGSADQIRAFMSPSRSAILSTVGIVVLTFLIYGLQAAYLHLVSKLGGESSLGYGQWFGFSAWTGFVSIFQSLLMLSVIFMAGGNQLPQHDLTPLSINALFIHAEPSESWFTWGQSFGVFNFWALALMAIGYNRWTGVSIGKSAAIVVAPWAVVFGGWALVIGL